MSVYNVDSLTRKDSKLSRKRLNVLKLNVLRKSRPHKYLIKEREMLEKRNMKIFTTLNSES